MKLSAYPVIFSFFQDVFQFFSCLTISPIYAGKLKSSFVWCFSSWLRVWGIRDLAQLHLKKLKVAIGIYISNQMISSFNSFKPFYCILFVCFFLQFYGAIISHDVCSKGNTGWCIFTELNILCYCICKGKKKTPRWVETSAYSFSFIASFFVPSILFSGSLIILLSYN